MVSIGAIEDAGGTNEEYAALNRRTFAEAGVLAVNFKGTPGSGKTSLLERSVRLLGTRYRLGAIEIDPFSARDALRLKFAGIPVCQLNTNDSPGVQAELVHRALPQLPLDNTDVLFIENAGYDAGGKVEDLGEDCRVTVLSVTEGADEYARVPAVFQDSDAILINKVDLLRHTDVNFERLHASLVTDCPFAPIFHVSARNHACLVYWTSWISSQLARKRRRVQGTVDNVVPLRRCEGRPS